MFSLNHVRNLYERALAIYCTDVGLWDDYILFLVNRQERGASVSQSGLTSRAFFS